jgi:hypothetical protein
MLISVVFAGMLLMIIVKLELFEHEMEVLINKENSPCFAW